MIRRTLFLAALFLGILACAWALYSLVTGIPLVGARTGTAAVVGYDPGGRAIYVGRANLLQALFREPFETVVFIYEDYSFITWTTQEDHRVGGSVDMIAEYLDDIGKSLPLVRDIIHNHLTPSRFSERDTMSYHQYRAAGFRGRYGIYYPFSKSILWKDN